MTPVTSPTAQTPSDARHRPSISMPCGPKATSRLSSPISSTRGVRPIATSSSCPATSLPSSRRTTRRPPPAATSDAPTPSRTATPSSSRYFPISSPTAASSRGSGRSAVSTTVTADPKRRRNWPSSIPTGPPPSTTTLSGISFERGCLAVGPVARLLETSDRRHLGVAAGRDHDAVGLEQLAVNLDAPGTGDARLGLEDPDAVALVAGDLVAVVEVADHVVAVLGHLAPGLLRGGGAGGAVGPGTHPRRAEQRLGRDAGPVGALAAHQLTLDERGPQSELGQSGGRDLAGGTGSHDDRI